MAGERFLVAYFSWSGNTRRVAQLICEEVEGDIFEIRPAVPYPDSYSEVLEQARREIRSGYKPPLKEVRDVSPYSVIFIGSPNWWGTIAPPVAAFLAGQDFSGKTLAPFCTHGGGGLGRMAEDIARLCPEATILEPLSIYEGDLRDLQATRAKVAAWLNRIGIK